MHYLPILPIPYPSLTVLSTLSFIHTKKQPLNDCLISKPLTYRPLTK